MADEIIQRNRCCHCKINKPASEFYRNRSRPNGIAAECKQCIRPPVYHCLRCGAQITAKGKCCQSCTAKTRKNRRTLESRFWDHVIKGPDCWQWRGATRGRGCGAIFSDPPFRKHLRASRVSWEIHNGPIPDGLIVCHKCDNPPCTNPEHLFLGTYKDNTQDMLRKGRGKKGPFPNKINYARGERHYQAKLTDQSVKNIRRLYPAMNVSQLSRMFNVHRGAIRAVIHRRTWIHVP